MIRKARLEQISRVMQGSVMTNRSASTRQNSMVEEIRIPVPWGHIAGKWWGRQDSQPIIALHGLFDNCCSFDRLIPLLDAPSVLALDSPGHGLSSHVPNGITLTVSDCLLCLRHIIKKHFNWTKVTLMGHSFGSCLAFIYSGLFPDDVDKFVSIDCARFNMAPRAENFALAVRAALDAVIEPPRLQELPYDQLLDHFYSERKSRRLEISKKYCDILLKRSSRQTDSGQYVITVDPRLPHFVDRAHVDLTRGLARRITCSVLSIRADDGVLTERRKVLYDEQLGILKESCKYFESIDVEGGHHVHLEQPEILAPTINRFLTKEYSEK